MRALALTWLLTLVLLQGTAAAAPHDTTLLSREAAGGLPGDASSSVPAVSGNGQYVVFVSLADLVAADTDGEGDVYRRHLATGTLDIVSTGSTLEGVTSEGIATTPYVYGPTVSDDGTKIAFAG